MFSYRPNPHQIKRMRQPLAKQASGFNSWLAVKITNGVGTMWCAYLFAAIALISLPEAVRGGVATLIAWIAQTFLQLVLLAVIMVGQKVQSEASDKRADLTYHDAEAILHEIKEVQRHLAHLEALRDAGQEPTISQAE